MNMDNVFNLLGSMLTIATITVILGSPNTVTVIRQAGRTFTRTMRTAMTGQ